MQRHATAASRVRSLAAASVLLVAAAASVQPAHAQSCGAQSDFLVRSDPLLAPIRPADCATVFQAPPDFTWPPQSGSNTYTVSLTFPDGRTETRSTSKNWLPWEQQSSPGEYTWKVSVAVASNQTGENRTFTVDTAAVPFVTPSGETALNRAKNTARPRSWANDSTSPILAAKAERAGGFDAMKADV